MATAHTLRTESVADVVATSRQQPSWLSLIATPTLATRDFANEQLMAVQLAYVAAVIAIALSEFAHPSISRPVLWVWLAESGANLVLRLWLFSKLLKVPGEGYFPSRALRLIPLVCTVIVGLHWVWTVQLFVGHVFTVTVFILAMSFVLMSVASLSISAASPVVAIAYPAFLWIPLGLRLASSQWLSAGSLAVLLFSAMSTVGMAFFTVNRHLRKYLLQADELELLVKQLNTANDELKRANAELTRHRTEVQAELSARSEYFSSVNHDVRQRLHAVKLLIQAQTAPTDGTPAKRDQPASRRLQESVVQLDRYLTDMLDFARLEGIAQERSLAQVELQDVFQAMDLQFEDIAEAKQVALRFRPSSAVLVTDRTMLTRILENLVSNAIKFSRVGTGIVVAARRRGNGLSIEVWDQGEGIPKDARADVFRAFYQVSFYAKRKGGVGMGLAIVDRLARSLGYRVEVHSREGRGTAMKVIVPDCAGEAVPMPPATQGASVRIDHPVAGTT